MPYDLLALLLQELNVTLTYVASNGTNLDVRVTGRSTRFLSYYIVTSRCHIITRAVWNKLYNRKK